MAKNLRGNGSRVVITATAARTSGDFVVEDDFHGTCCSDIADTETGLLDIEQVEIEVDLVATAAVGDSIYMSDATTMTKTVGENRLVGKVTAVTATNAAVPSTKMRMLVLPQVA